ncbi:hypothetical protein GDO86_000154 [Hymenochirus boettgeri]|uniref:Ring finger protein 4 n=1 Tax=Hymenochirus boettgeri TaxID=247094 RepID=A0A8T2K7D2_9PIPI|nr:hypothetical protein GDO86_000154 [Hymenochirus boettgeri]
MNTAQRKRKGAQSVRSKSSKRRTSSSASRMTEETEPIELESGEEVVDLTCESSEPVVVDLTNNDLSINDSVVVSNGIFLLGLFLSHFIRPFSY